MNEEEMRTLECTQGVKLRKPGHSLGFVCCVSPLRLFVGGNVSQIFL